MSIDIDIDNNTKRFVLFVFGCIVIRAYLVYLAKTINKDYLPIFGSIAIIPAIGFFLIYLNGWRKYGAETFGDKIWWNWLRPVHGSLYLLFSFMAINKNHSSWIPLMLDLLIGVSFWLKYKSV